MATWMRRFVLTFCSLALIVLVGGCGMDQSPVASGAEEEGTALEPAGKKIKVKKGDKKKISMRIGRQGGKLVIKEDEEGNDDDLKVEFIVPKKALNEKVKITMKVHGETLDDLVIEFAPGGLVFEKPAKLKIYLGEERVSVPLEMVEIVHHYADGSSEVVPVRIKEKKNKDVIIIRIPGFSRYSMGP